MAFHGTLGILLHDRNPPRPPYIDPPHPLTLGSNLWGQPMWGQLDPTPLSYNNNYLWGCVCGVNFSGVNFGSIPNGHPTLAPAALPLIASSDVYYAAPRAQTTRESQKLSISGSLFMNLPVVQNRMSEISPFGLPINDTPHIGDPR